MSRFFRKYSLAFLFVSLFSFSVNGQVLDNANLNLNTGGYVNDVVYSPYHNCYIVVGNFTKINNQSRRNIAFLDKTTLAVLATNNVFPIDSVNGMNGEIRTVAIRTSNTLPSTTISLYIGGNFSSVQKNGIATTRYGIAKFTCTQSLIPALPPGNFSLSSWNPDLEMVSLDVGPYSDGVNDILISNDTIVFCGRFGEVNNSTTPIVRDGIAAYSISGTLLNYPNFSTVTYYENSFYHLEKKAPIYLLVVQ